MLDIGFIKENRKIIEEAIRNKQEEEVDIDTLLNLYEQRKKLQQNIDDIRRKQNVSAETRNIEQGKNLKDALKEIQEREREVSKAFRDLLVKIPNVPSADTPIGKDETENVVIRTKGERPEFSFEPKEHNEIGVKLDIFDTERAAKVSGSRFTYIKGAGALMQLALMNFVFKSLTNEETLKHIAHTANLDVSTKPFVPVFPPAMIRPEMLFGMARLEPKEDRFFLEEDKLFLVGSAEHTLGAMLAGEILNEKDTPIRYIGYSTAYRREAGSYGKDTRGIIRQHQFDKLEMESFTSPNDSRIEHEFFIAIQEYLVHQLGLHYQVVAVCTGDMGAPNHKQTDIEVWMPGQGVFRETHSADLIGSYQSKRLGIKIQNAEGKKETAHTNDATAFAIGRTLAAIVENNQQADGSVRVPDVLRDTVGSEYIHPL